jgi:methionyl-tRNA formyltransferase
MRVVFMGTPDFAVPSLNALADRHEVVCVYTRPDAVSGRGGSLRRSPVAEAALQLALPLAQPTSLRDPEVQEHLRGLEPDVIVVAAYGMILPAEVLEIPRLGCINVHASLLPRWRGAAPIQRAILAGDEQTGVSIMLMEEGLDTGPYCAVASTAIETKTTEQLTDELAHMGAELLTDSLPLIERGACNWTSQDESAVTYAEKIDADSVAITPELSASDALRRIRASSPQAPSRVRIGERAVTVLRASVSDKELAPGSIECEKKSLLIGMTGGTLALDKVKPDGKSEMAGCDWSRGARFDSTEQWSDDR